MRNTLRLLEPPRRRTRPGERRARLQPRIRHAQRLCPVVAHAGHSRARDRPCLIESRDATTSDRTRTTPTVMRTHGQRSTVPSSLALPSRARRWSRSASCAAGTAGAAGHARSLGGAAATGASRAPPAQRLAQRLARRARCGPHTGAMTKTTTSARASFTPPASPATHSSITRRRVRRPLRATRVR